MIGVFFFESRRDGMIIEMKDFSIEPRRGERNIITL